MKFHKIEGSVAFSSSNSWRIGPWKTFKNSFLWECSGTLRCFHNRVKKVGPVDVFESKNPAPARHLAASGKECCCTFFQHCPTISTIPSMNGTCLSACAHHVKPLWTQAKVPIGVVHRKGCSFPRERVPMGEWIFMKHDHKINHCKYRSCMHLDGLKPW